MNATPQRSILITAGPTYEPIDAVRFIGNRSSGRLGIELAKAARDAGWKVTFLLGPNTHEPPPSQSGLTVQRFRTCADLEVLLTGHWPDRADVLVMAAAVADYRPKTIDNQPDKIRRNAGQLTLYLESTPDLVAACATRKQPGQIVVGFALEPAVHLTDRAASKLKRKHLDAIVANPLESMDAPDIEATLLFADGTEDAPGRLSKAEFAKWLITQVGDLHSRHNATRQAVR